MAYGAGAQNITSLVGTEALEVNTSGSVSAQVASDVLGWLTQSGKAVVNSNTATASATLTGANISGGGDVTLNLSGTLAGAANATLPTVANLVAAIRNPVAGLSYKLRVINSSSGAFTWTVVTNTGWTTSGTLTVAQNTFRDFVVSLTSLTAATITSVGTGSYS